MNRGSNFLLSVYRYSGKNCCNAEGCDKWSRGSSGKCVKHGYDSRCKIKGCDKSNRGSSETCWQHGGLCKIKGCDKSSRGSSEKCWQHGGSVLCKIKGCGKWSRRGGKCIVHDGKRCCVSGCKTSSESSGKCAQHGGGVRCQVAECSCVPCKSAKTSQCSVHLDFSRTAASLMDYEMESQQECSLELVLGKSLRNYSFILITLC